jgi:hypothetical protein
MANPLKPETANRQDFDDTMRRLMNVPPPPSGKKAKSAKPKKSKRSSKNKS